MKVVHAILFRAILFASVSANGQAFAEGESVEIRMTGNALTSHCRAHLNKRRNGGQATAQQHHDAALCYGFVAGYLDFNSTRQAMRAELWWAPKFCPPRRLNANDAAEVVGNYLDRNPQQRHLSGFMLVGQAFAEAYRCNL